jgi:hypothetical protein
MNLKLSETFLSEIAGAALFNRYNEPFVSAYISSLLASHAGDTSREMAESREKAQIFWE